MKIKMKYVTIIVIFWILMGCNSTKFVQPDSPDNTAWLMKLAIDNDDYETFNSLFSDGRKGSISRRDFKELQDITTAGFNLKRYEVITFENGKMLLVRLTPLNKDNEYEIEDVILVPDEMNNIFSDKGTLVK
ncbi:hypothetical protein ACFSCX_19575 [Bacillus salitolerans]|uniref:DUF3887 domain-containing protein n=1 Tax=Bacillus salitolerans TaxID=1437434 RepID=A0ABW4LUD0_9BACI